MGGDNAGQKPVRGMVTVELESPAGTTNEDIETVDAGTASSVDVVLPVDWERVTVTYAYGNTGWMEAVVAHPPKK